MVPISYYYALALTIFLCGLVGILVRRSLILMLMSIELMLNGVNLIFVAASKHWANLDGQIMTFFVITVAACEAAVGLAMVIALFRRHGTVDTDQFRILRG